MKTKIAALVLVAAPIALVAGELKLKDGASFCGSRKNAECLDPGSNTERGVVNGVRYRLFGANAYIATMDEQEADSFGRDVVWSVHCQRDKMSGSRNCHASFKTIFMFFEQNGNESLLVGSDHFPGTVTSIKIGDKRFDTRDRDGEFPNGRTIINSFRDGKTAVTRYTKWPYRAWIDDEFTLRGSELAVQLSRWLVKNTERAPD